MSAGDRLVLGQIRDDWLLGLICRKTGLESWAMENLGISSDTDRERLFSVGVAAAENYSFDDIAVDLMAIRRRSSKLFDRMVARAAGTVTLNEIKSAIDRLEKRGHVQNAPDSIIEFIRRMCAGNVRYYQGGQ